MKKVLLIITSLLFAITVNAQIAGINLGDDYETVKEKAEQKFGPSYESSHDIITYHDIGYGNIYWANLAFLFQYDSGRSYLHQIMFVNSTNTASDVKAEREKLKGMLDKYNWEPKILFDGFKSYVAHTDDGMTVMIGVNKGNYGEGYDINLIYMKNFVTESY